MAMDFDVASYPRWDDLRHYMDGSAAVIGEMMLPVLEPLDHAAAFQPARDLGLAFQLTNFLRDVGEGLERGRVYLPEEDLDRFGADARARTVTPPPRSAACVRTARILYSRILVESEANIRDVFSTRDRVSTGRKLATAARCLGGTIGTRRP
jgi:phytoene synthase